jgi:hypothetical protein
LRIDAQAQNLSLSRTHQTVGEHCTMSEGDVNSGSVHFRITR